ncbi:DMSO reductase anchor subunit [Clostridium pasteurianum DSM 525 = ATCC 6013]|uniref:DMSO reductase anchor subunit n=1 Tax=Clostridium pasteurianum DSM 525 = ATCC 6013 TaxID=1262449 RepID=A0A0H3J7M6_CLOPA|nr:DmsC/YnfH family molybdoenzyme membrane anchor subunit [Clostridium pasteurianum]AJA49479.1 DMSO reductase anchor subunit [Clostridium pasteurianum DSM 525 = ATCC 6013]AJA53467.1 DMSO reductase anchor subunit [Clostridium pasteurianum DSM 525 = ATCC 6013]AOZ76643.1 DMSO reductase [Clostridium pasteurianum DSM 525 = ATCC 6013]AOZ80440.1 DMSO reductase [Clostridium pasteurianum]ELP58406.1 DMSO reductase anchor subunit [Clostridium pasteurianum DSM 525 = ATCC 6013]
MSELGLLIFSIGIESSVGIILFLAIIKLKNRDSIKKLPIIIAAAFIIIAVFAYWLNLGQPFKMVNTLKNIKSSWLSRAILFSGILVALNVINTIVTFVKPSQRITQIILTLLAVAIGLTGLSKEILFFGILIALIVANVIITFVKPSSRLTQNIFIWLSSVIGIIDIAIIGNVYTFTGIPSWNGIGTFINFYTSVILIGGILYYSSDYRYQTEKSKKFIGTAIFLAFIIQIVSEVFYRYNLSTLGTVSASGSSILVILKYLFAVFAVIFFFWKGISGKKYNGINLIRVGNEAKLLAVLFIIVSAIISKYLFYAVFITTKIGEI